MVWPGTMYIQAAELCRLGSFAAAFLNLRWQDGSIDTATIKTLLESFTDYY